MVRGPVRRCRTSTAATWFPHYLPAWSSRERSRASHRLDADGLTLDIPVDHPLWCEGDHDPPLRVSGVQSGNWSGPVGSTHGQQRFREGQVVLEEQERFEGWLPSARGRPGRDLGPDGPLAPLDGRALDERASRTTRPSCSAASSASSRSSARTSARTADPSAEVGVGIKAFRDPALHPGLRGAPARRSTSPSRTSTPSTGTPTRRSSPSTGSWYAAARARRRTRCS